MGTPSAVGGSITHSHEVIRALEQLGVDVDPVTTDAAIALTAAREPEPPCEWRLVEGARALRGVPASAALAGDMALVAAAAREIAHVDAIYQRHARFSLAGALLSRLTGKPLLLEYNGSEEWVQKNWQPTPFAGQLRRCEDAALAAAARVIVVSDVERRTLVERGIDPKRILVNPNGVDADRFARGGGEVIRRSHGFSGANVVYGFLGTFGPWHGVPVLARAFRRIAERVEGARLLLVGSGSERDAVRAELAQLEAQKCVAFVDSVPPSAVPAHLDACDVLVSPHVWRPGTGEFFGSPTKLFEYMATGKPIVASRLGQIGTVLDDERSALLTEPGDEDALVEACVRLAGDPALRARLGAAARADAIERHSWRSNAQRVIDTYDELRGDTR